jgi:hypothetical protein
MLLTRRITSFSIFLLLGVASVSAQDPLTVAPQAYKLEFENEWVKVVRVHYGPNEMIPVHDHTALAAAYVYLNDGGPILFKHIGTSYGPVTRPATKTGGFRIYKGINEVHEVENPTELPNDFLRIEFKTRIIDEKTLRGRFHREPYPEGENYRKVQFEDEQIRVSRLICAPGGKLEIPSGELGPALLVSFSTARVQFTGNRAKTVNSNLEAGRTGWQPAGRGLRIESPKNAPAEMLRIEFKTEVVKDAEAKAKAHDHLHK